MSSSTSRLRGTSRRATAGPLSLLFIVSVTFLFAMLPGVMAEAEPTDPIELMNLIYSPEATTRAQVAALWAGVNAALYNAGYKTAAGRDIVVYEKDDSDTGLDVVATMQTALDAHPNILAAIGPFSDNRLSAMIKSPLAVQNNLVCMAPYTGSSAVRLYSRNMYFFRADPNAELMVLLKSILNTQKAMRIGFMYLTGVLFGDSELATTRAQLASLGRAAPIVYAAAYKDAFSQALFDEFANQNPQAVLIWGMPGTHVQAFIKQLLIDPRTSDTTIYASIGLQDAVIAVNNAVVTAGLTTSKENHIYFSTTNALPSATELNYIKVFQTEMHNYLLNSPDSPDQSQPDAFLNNLALGELMVGGWVGGRALLQTLDNARWTVNRSAYQAGLFEQNRYVIEGDFFIGNFGGECVTPYASLDGAVCQCNQGGRTTYLKRLFANGTLSMMLDTRFSYSGTTCYSNAESLPTPVNVLVMDFPENDLLHNTYTEVYDFSRRSATALNAATTAVSYNVFDSSTTTDNVAQGVDAVKENYQVDVLIGPVPLGADMGGNLLIDPIFVKPAMSFNDSMMVSLMPTMEQQIYVAYYFVNSGVGNGYLARDDIHVITKGFSTKQAETLKDVAGKTAQTLNMPVPSFKQIDDAVSITSEYGTTGGYFSLGITEADVHDIAVYLSQNPKVFALITYQDLARYYATFLREFGAIADPTMWFRCTFLSSLPPWNDVSDKAHAASPTLQKFHATFPDAADHTPLALQTFITTELLAYLVSVTPKVNSTTLRTSLYQSSVFVLDDMQFGPFRDCSTSEAVACDNRNYGATSIGALSMLRVFDPSQAYNLEPMVPSMIYTTPPVDKSLSTGQIVGIAIGCAAAVAAIIAVVLVIVCCCCNNSRDNKNAPQKLADPVTLVFTDIESSTALWAAVPEEMPDAVATHHKLIRQLIADYKCYEVKTIGDSFMIACKSPGAAVNLARDIQTKFLKHDWKTPEIDDAYHQFEMNREQEEQEEQGNDAYRAHSAHLSPDVYSALWNGLRVRIGVHTGLSDIRQDEITKGYDYYGETSNMAARTEAIAHGGQVVLTEATWWALSQSERELLDGASMGHQGLRGVPYAVEMYQLNAVVGRNFPPLRTEIEAYLPSDEFSHDGSSATDALLSSAGTLTGPSAAIAAVLTNCFSPYPPQRRVKELQPLLEKWGIPVPPRSRNITDADYAQGLTNRLALKMSTVAQVRMRLGGGADNGLNSTALLDSKRASGAFSSAPSMNPRPSTQRGREAGGGLNSAALAELEARRVSVARRSTSASQRLVMTSPLDESLDLVDEVAPYRRIGGRRVAPARGTTNPLNGSFVAPHAAAPPAVAAPGSGPQEDTIFVRMPSDLGAN